MCEEVTADGGDFYEEGAMLLLGRKCGEQIIIDTQRGRVTVTVVEIRHNGTVRIGIDAPAEMPVHRAEVQRDIDNQA